MTKPAPTGSLAALQFDNRFTRALPADSEESNSPRQVHGACYSRVYPFQVRKPELLAHATEVSADLLDLSGETTASTAFAETFSGNRILSGMDPFAMCYGGHQFGHWAGQLGDGRAINLGEVINGAGEHWTLQLKGAGPTPYSRTADGFAVLRSSVREFLCSEAMFHLGVPTTRALSLAATGEWIMRDMFYDGRAKVEPGAVVCRVARSFTRFGNFQILADRGDAKLLRKLLEHTIRSDFPHLDAPPQGQLSADIINAWFKDVCQRTSDMIIHWMRVGFVHGVMNTDNMSILGDTIDYGPYGWLEDHDPSWTPNTTDAGGRRYCYGNQASMAHWNLVQLANAVAVLLDGETDTISSILEDYPRQYARDWRAMMLSKLGLVAGGASDSSNANDANDGSDGSDAGDAGDATGDQALIDELLEVLQLVETDMTLFYRQLAKLPLEGATHVGKSDEELCSPLLAAYYKPDEVPPEARAQTAAWLRKYGERVAKQGTSDAQRLERMNAVNPIYVLRNYLAQVAIEAAEQGDPSGIHKLQEVLRQPYGERPNLEEYAAKRPEWARNRPGCSMLSCSS